MVVVQRDHPLAGLDIIHLRDLEGYTVLVQGPHLKIYSRLCKLVENQHINANVSCVHEALMQFSVIDENPKTVCISTKRVAQGMISGNMVCIPFDATEMAWDLTLIQLKGAELSPMGEEFRKMLLSLSGRK